VRRVEDPRFITGEGRYITNMEIEGAAWAAFVRSSVAHGRITGIETAEAASASGVIAVFTVEDLEIDRMPIDAPGQPDSTRRPPLSRDTVRFVGDIVAVVVAETEREAIEGSELVWVDIDPLPPLIDPYAALEPDAPLLFPEHGSNVVLEGDNEQIDDLFGDADVVVRQRIHHQRLAAVPLEANATIAIPRGEDLDIYVASQNVFFHRNTISKALNVDRERLHVKVPDMGGGFGAKISVYPEQALVAALALRLNRPVRWHERRRENMVAMTQGRAQYHGVEIGAKRDGTITALRFDVLQDAGAYPLNGAHTPEFTRRMASGPYRIPKVEFKWRSVVTNTTPTHAYRGAGRPEATMSIERMLDLLALELWMDPAELRRRNFIAEFPAVTATGERYDTGDYKAALDLALTHARYEDLRREQAERRQSRSKWQLGIGISSYVEITAPEGRKDWGSVTIEDDGTVTVRSGASSHGQGHETAFAQVVASVLRVPIESIRFIQGDSDEVARGGGTMGSRSLQMAGSAVLDASDAVLKKARELRARLAEASPEDVVQFEDGSIGVIGVPDSAMTLSELAVAALDTRSTEDEPGLWAEEHRIQQEATVPFGTHVSVVEVDTETGDLRLLSHVACDDCGSILNRRVVDGQVHGGVVQAAGQAVFEQILYDEAGNPLTANLTSYVLPSASCLPMIDVDHTVTPTEQNPLGAKGIGEAGTIGAGPAIVNAVIDALTPLGVRHIDMPLTPRRVWEAIERANSSRKPDS